MVTFHGELLNNQMVRENPTKMDEYIHSPSYPQIHMPLKEDQIKQLRDVFMMIDGNGDGTDLRKKTPFLTQGDGPLGDGYANFSTIMLFRIFIIG